MRIPREFVARGRLAWRTLRRPREVESEIDEEFRFHLEQRANDLARSGVSPAEALLQARREFGLTSRYREEGRLSRGLHRLDAIRFSWLDLKLGARMMGKYPGLTLIAGIGMAVAIAIGTGYASAVHVLLDSSLPVPDGDRVVALQNWDVRANRRAATSVQDFVSWRDGLRSVQDVGAYRTVTRNLLSDAGAAEPVSIAEMSASGFRVARARPVLGRYILDDDEAPGAPSVVVLGYDAWTKRFASDSSIIGRQLRLGTSVHTVVGVMPEGYGFPISHEYWIPLSRVEDGSARGEQSALNVFGRLSPGSSLSQAAAEIELIGRRAADRFPESHGQLRAQVFPYTRPTSGMDNPDDLYGALLIPFLTSLVLVAICVNVAVLIYARTAVRHGEIVVRTALGASRRRVVAQLFAEALVLAAAATLAGLAITGFALNQTNAFLAVAFGGQLPFWMDFGLSLGAIVYAAALAVLAAVITGVLPALKATGPRLQHSLQQLSGVGGAPRLGRMWTALIVGQVSVAVAVLPVAVFQARSMFGYATVDAGFDAQRFVIASVEMEAPDRASVRTQYPDRLSEVARRLREDPGIDGVTLASSAPGKERYQSIEVEPARANDAPGNSSPGTVERGGARTALVDLSYFGAFGVRLLSGRLLMAGDADSSAVAVVVNSSFVKSYFPSGDALGRRIRLLADAGDEAGAGDGSPPRWREVVGVVADFPSAMIPEQVEEKVYQAASPAGMYPATLAVRLRDAAGPNARAAARPENLADVSLRLRRVAAGVDPALQLRNVRNLGSVYDGDQSALRLIGYGIVLVTLSVLLLSSAGVYALMSLAVTRRRREIGIRAALGADARHILTDVFARAAAQLGVGIGIGLAMIFLVDRLALHGALAHDATIVSAVATIILTVGLLASLGPARRGLGIQPVDALKQE